MPTLPEGLILSGTTTSPRGRSITASRVFKPGDVIATFDSPNIAIPDSPHLSTTCSGCLLPATATGTGGSDIVSGSRPGRVVRECTGCRTVAYCSPACQKLDWTTGGHKAECKVFKRVKAEGHEFLPTPVRALAQILVRPEMGAALAEMQGHTDKFRQESGKLWMDMELQAMAALHYLGREGNPRNLAGAIDILCKLQVNSFNRLDEDVDQTGLFLNPALAMVNHSCIPNAFVQLVGRQAVLHAYQEIKKGEEIQISYIDCNTHLSHRHEALKTRYHFACDCPRCKDDLDVYQVCKVYPHLNLNSLSLAPGIQDPENSQISRPPTKHKSLKDIVEETYAWCSAALIGFSETERIKQLRQRWKAIKPLTSKFHAHAVEPVPRVLTEASMHFAERGNFAYCLCISSFLATRIDPYKAAAPFAPQRVKGMLMIAKLLVNATAVESEGGTEPGALVSAKTMHGKISQVMRETDQATVCQVLLELVVRYAPAAHSRKWSVLYEAQDLLSDLESLQGRETGDALVKAFLRNPGGIEEKQFFEQAVLQPIHRLSELCLDIMDSEFGS